MRGLGTIGESAEMMTVFAAVIRFSALSDLPMLIAGEIGTGKKAFARAVHSLDPKRSQGPFVPVNRGAISTSLVESEFFGHRRGAFTGAQRERKGLFRSRLNSKDLTLLKNPSGVSSSSLAAKTENMPHLITATIPSGSISQDSVGLTLRIPKPST
ncbi:MAG TPA: sigma 54-interacting transcriptional regulator [Terriglobales bacterium]|nr:sigma 54-interacting transcriptional regulator [Terriglobales bacterium]